MQRFPATIELALLSMILAVLIGVPVGIASASRRNSLLDSVSMIGSLVGVSMPIFWLGLMEIMLFAVFLQWLPSSGRLSSSIQLEAVTNFVVIDSLISGNWEALD